MLKPFAAQALQTQYLRTAPSIADRQRVQLATGRICRKERKRHQALIFATSTDFEAELTACESSGDWLKAVEIVAEARALKEQLPSGAVEAGVRIFARHGQHQRSVILLQSAPSKDSVSLETLQAVFAALLQANEAALSLRLLKDIDWSTHGEEARTEAFNTVVRTCARGEMLDEGLALLEQMQKSKMDVGRATFDSLALGCLKAGRGEEAEQLFDERDYL